MSPFPLRPADLERFRIHARRRARPSQVGGHLVRRRGLGLEFREFMPYTPGDDYRHIDWRASARLGRDDAWLVRSFHAEEQLTLAISIDSRSSMHLPAAGCKLDVACWLARALTDITLNGDDRVILHRLFSGAGGAGLMRAAGAREHARAHRFLDRLRATDTDEEAPLNLDALQPYLPPAVVWVIISDFYFGRDAATAGALGRALARAQAGYRWVVLVELDSWPHERAGLGLGARLIDGPGLAHGHLQVELEPAALDGVENRIRAHVAGVTAARECGAVDHDHWRWPATRDVDLPAFFRERFLGDRVLEQLFMRDPA